MPFSLLSDCVCFRFTWRNMPLKFWYELYIDVNVGYPFFGILPHIYIFKCANIMGLEGKIIGMMGGNPVVILPHHWTSISEHQRGSNDGDFIVSGLNKCLSFCLVLFVYHRLRCLVRSKTLSRCELVTCVFLCLHF